MQGIEVLLNKKMDRREFLVYLGMLVLTFIGVKNILAAILNIETANKNTKVNSFGAGPYGGTKGGING